MNHTEETAYHRPSRGFNTPPLTAKDSIIDSIRELIARAISKIDELQAQSREMTHMLDQISSRAGKGSLIYNSHSSSFSSGLGPPSSSPPVPCHTSSYSNPSPSPPVQALAPSLPSSASIQPSHFHLYSPSSSLAILPAHEMQPITEPDTISSLRTSLQDPIPPPNVPLPFPSAQQNSSPLFLLLNPKTTPLLKTTPKPPMKILVYMRFPGRLALGHHMLERMLLKDLLWQLDHFKVVQLLSTKEQEWKEQHEGLEVPLEPPPSSQEVSWYDSCWTNKMEAHLAVKVRRLELIKQAYMFEGLISTEISTAHLEVLSQTKVFTSDHQKEISRKMAIFLHQSPHSRMDMLYIITLCCCSKRGVNLSLGQVIIESDSTSFFLNFPIPKQNLQFELQRLMKKQKVCMYFLVIKPLLWASIDLVLDCMLEISVSWQQIQNLHNNYSSGMWIVPTILKAKVQENHGGEGYNYSLRLHPFTLFFISYALELAHLLGDENMVRQLVTSGFTYGRFSSILACHFELLIAAAYHRSTTYWQNNLTVLEILPKPPLFLFSWCLKFSWKNKIEGIMDELIEFLAGLFLHFGITSSDQIQEQQYIFKTIFTRKCLAESLSHQQALAKYFKVILTDHYSVPSALKYKLVAHNSSYVGPYIAGAANYLRSVTYCADSILQEPANIYLNLLCWCTTLPFCPTSGGGMEHKTYQVISLYMLSSQSLVIKMLNGKWANEITLVQAARRDKIRKLWHIAWICFTLLHHIVQLRSHYASRTRSLYRWRNVTRLSWSNSTMSTLRTRSLRQGGFDTICPLHATSHRHVSSTQMLKTTRRGAAQWGS